MRQFILVVLLLGTVTERVCSQSFYAVRRERNVIATFGTGTATYFGDLKNPGINIDSKLNINAGLQYFMTPRIAVRSELNWFQISGSDQYANDDRRERNLSFKSSNIELNACGIINLFPNRGVRYYRRVGFNIYGFAGVGVVYINPKTMYQGKWEALQPLQTEGINYSKFQFVIPYGLGVKIKQGPFLNICIEGGLRKTFTDYLDDVSSTRYPDPATLKSDLSRALSDRRGEYFSSIGEPWTSKPNVGKRGNPANKDSYFLLNIKFEYYLPYDLTLTKSRHYKIYNPRRKYNFNKQRYSK